MVCREIMIIIIYIQRLTGGSEPNSRLKKGVSLRKLLKTNTSSL